MSRDPVSPGRQDRRRKKKVDGEKQEELSPIPRSSAGLEPRQVAGIEIDTAPCSSQIFKMGKKNKSQPAKESQPDAAPSTSGLPFLAGNASVDPTVSSLFEQSVRDLAVAYIYQANLKLTFPFNYLGWSS